MLQDFDENPAVRLWLLFMLERVGHNNLPKLLDYYEGIGWISSNASNKLLELADKERRFNGPAWTLSAHEHRKSMLFIEKISGKLIDDSLLNIEPGRAVIESSGKETNEAGRPRAGYLEGHNRKKEELEFMLQRREVTIRNLEDELEQRDVEIGILKERLKEMEKQLSECQNEIKKDLVYRRILDENLRLRKVDI